MATRSFYFDMVIDTPEAARNLEKAIEAADKRGPLEIGEVKGITEDPEIVRKLIEKYGKH